MTIEGSLLLEILPPRKGNNYPKRNVDIKPEIISELENTQDEAYCLHSCIVKNTLLNLKEMDILLAQARLNSTLLKIPGQRQFLLLLSWMPERQRHLKESRLTIGHLFLNVAYLGLGRGAAGSDGDLREGAERSNIAHSKDRVASIESCD
ncbi:hypothetical protein VNO78_09347 [Psophocarpus tetragonolobus]|uniref:Uncharacterized protein n=1 Tax=Psophocarpus tetragonolobus TaxID=3891 RepID=A0AAN9SY88_PSOTE